MYRPLAALGLIGLFFAGAALADDLPNLAKTPGSVRAGLTKAKICGIKWARTSGTSPAR